MYTGKDKARKKSVTVMIKFSLNLIQLQKLPKSECRPEHPDGMRQRSEGSRRHSPEGTDNQVGPTQTTPEGLYQTWALWTRHSCPPATCSAASVLWAGPGPGLLQAQRWLEPAELCARLKLPDHEFTRHILLESAELLFRKRSFFTKTYLPKLVQVFTTLAP